MIRSFNSKILLILALAVPPIATGTGNTHALERSCVINEKFALAVHGGAVWGNLPHVKKEAFIKNLLQTGRAKLKDGDRAIDVVETMITEMENSGLFNAGKGSVANRSGEIEMDASIMDGKHLRAGSVASVRKLKNPIIAARKVMDDTPHVMMVGPAAERYLENEGVETTGPEYFLYSGESFPDVSLPETIKQPIIDPSVPKELARFSGVWSGVIGGRLNHVVILDQVNTNGASAFIALGANEALGISSPVTIEAKATFLNEFLILKTEAFRVAYRFTKQHKLEAILSLKNGIRSTGHLKRNPGFLKSNGTVGAVALDRCGNLAAGTSTGGFNSKLPGRVGDSPVIGAGTYADNRSVAVSATGHGEYFIRHAVAHEIAARIRHGGETIIQAAYRVVMKELKNSGGGGGVIAIDRSGEIVMLYNTDGMVRGRTTDQLPPKVETYFSD